MLTGQSEDRAGGQSAARCRLQTPAAGRLEPHGERVGLRLIHKR